MIYSLQSIRFILALLIFHHHFFINPQIQQFGCYPVAFFFILSGFLMSVGYEGKVSNDSFSYRKFILKRCIHIYPLNFLGLAFWLLYPIIIDIHVGEFNSIINNTLLLDLLLLQSWWPESSVYFSGNGACWFLSDIIFCYILFPFLIKFIKYHNHLICFTSVLIGYFLIVYLIPKEYVHGLIYINPLSRIFDFIVGIQLYFFYKTLSNKKYIICISYKEKSILEFCTIIISLAFMLISAYVPLRYFYASIFWIPSVVTILIYSLNSENGGILSKILNKEYLCYLGKISFPFYVFHLPSITWCSILVSVIGINLPAIIKAIICIIITILISIIYIKYIEPLFTKKLRKLYE